MTGTALVEIVVAAVELHSELSGRTDLAWDISGEIDVFRDPVEADEVAFAIYDARGAAVRGTLMREFLIDQGAELTCRYLTRVVGKLDAMVRPAR